MSVFVDSTHNERQFKAKDPMRFHEESENPVQASHVSFSIKDLLIVTFSIAVLLCFFLPVLNRSRGPSRRTFCLNNMRQLSLACQNFQSARLRYPMPMGGFASHGHKGADRVSGLVMLLPGLEEMALYDTVFSPTTINGVSYTAAPAPWTKGYPVWQADLDVLRCPSAQYRNPSKSPFGQTNYAFCIGDSVDQIHNPVATRGVFACGIKTFAADIPDGTSNTIAFAEIGTSYRRIAKAQFAINQPKKFLADPMLGLQLTEPKKPHLYRQAVKLHSLGRGACWADGAAGYGLVNTILPPNRPSFAVGGSLAVDGVYTAGSFHSDGCNVAMADGSARFISDTIDAGMADFVPSGATPGPINSESKYGVWGALGSANGAEAIDSLDRKAMLVASQTIQHSVRAKLKLRFRS